MILGEKVVLRPNRFRFLKLLSLSKCLTILIIFSAKLRTQIWVKCVSQFYRKYGYLELIGFSKSWLWNSDLVTGLVFLILFISQFPSSIVSISINSISAILFIASYQISHGFLNINKSIRPIHLYRGSPPYAHFGTWKKPCYMKFVLVGLYSHCAKVQKYNKAK